MSSEHHTLLEGTQNQNALSSFLACPRYSFPSSIHLYIVWEWNLQGMKLHVYIKLASSQIVAELKYMNCCTLLENGKKCCFGHKFGFVYLCFDNVLSSGLCTIILVRNAYCAWKKVNTLGIQKVSLFQPHISLCVGKKLPKVDSFVDCYLNLCIPEVSTSFQEPLGGSFICLL